MADSLFHHSRRVFLWGMLKSQARGIEADPELAYVGGMFHDLGLTQKFRKPDQRFEIDGGNAAYDFLREHARSEQEARNVWLAIALHTTPEVPVRLAPEVGVVMPCVETDVLGLDLDEISDEDEQAVVEEHPRPDFKRQIRRPRPTRREAAEQDTTAERSRRHPSRRPAATKAR